MPDLLEVYAEDVEVRVSVRVRVEKTDEPCYENFRYINEITRSLGDDFIQKSRKLVMKVPSALISDAFNYLINPKHSDIGKVKILGPRPILFDKRLMEMIRTKNIE